MASATEAATSSPPKRSAARTISRRVLLGLGIALLLLSLLANYAQVAIISETGFADHVTATLNDPGVQSALSTAIVGRLVENRPKLQLAEPILQNAVTLVIGSNAFKTVFRASLIRTHHVLLSERNNQIVLNLSGQAAFVLGALSALDPGLRGSTRLQTARSRLKNISESNALLPVIRALNRVRVLGYLAPIVALLCFLGSIALGENRRRALSNVGWSIAVLSFIVWLLLAVGQWLSPSFVNDPLSEALPGIWQALLGDLRRWCLVLVVAGLIVVAIGNASRQPPDMRVLAARARFWLTASDSGPWRLVVLGATAVLFGGLLVFNPLALFRLLVVLAGAALTYMGVYAVLSLTASPTETSRSNEGVLGAGRWSALAVVVVALGILWVRNVLTV